MIRITLSLVICLFLLFPITVVGQNISGSISGTVSDPAGASVPNAVVVVTHTERNQVFRTVKTDDLGAFSAPGLPIGVYSITVEAAGFKKVTRAGITLNVNDKLTINVPMEVGAITEQVTVEAEIANIELQSSTAGNLISGLQIRELSLNNRNYEQLVALMPGVSSGAADQIYVGTTNPLGTNNTVSFSINGQRNSANNWTVDGADNVDRGSNLTLLNYPSVDALAEFKVLRGLYSAEFGRAAGGQINVVTKSGTNQFHGSAYEFVRNDAFAANNWINNANRVNPGSDGKAKVTPLRYNNFGYTIGGPVYIPGVYNQDKNKTFFFFSQEFRRVITYASSLATVPTEDQKRGIFTTPVCVASSGSTCTQTSTTITNISPLAQAYIKDIFSKIPAGNPTDNTLFVPLRSTYNHRQELYKIDHNFGEKLSVFGRYLTDSIPTVEPGGLFTNSPLPGVATTRTDSPGHTWVFRAQASFSPTLLNETGYAYSYGAIVSRVEGLVAAENSPDIKANLPFPVTLARVPSLATFNVSSFGPYDDFNRNHNFYDNLTKILGRHTIRAGVSVHHYQKTENAGGNNVGSFTFANTPRPAGASVFQQQWANFLLGNVSQFTQASLDLTPDIRAWQSEFYIQDDFRLRRNLVLNLGVRYSSFRQPWDERGMLTNFDPQAFDVSKAPGIDTTNGNIIAGSNPNYDQWNGIIDNGKSSPYGKKVAGEQNGDFAPRIGIAWDPTGSGKTSIRSGYGIFYDSGLVGVYEQNIFNNPPYVESVTISNTSLDDPTAGTPVVSLAPKTLRGTPVPFQTPYTQQWSLDIQRELPLQFTLDVGYYGSKGTNLLGIVDINQVPVGAGLAAGLHTGTGTAFVSADSPRLNALRPYRGYGPINTLRSWFNSNYHSLQVSLDKRFQDNGLFSLSYTWSKNLTDAGSDRSDAPQNTYNWKEGEYGRATLDRRHILTFNYVYELPFYRSQQGLTGHVLGGWQISGITQIGSGTPSRPTTTGVDPGGLGILGTSSAGPRPDWICNPNTDAPHTAAQWFNTACFADVPAGQVRPGNAGRYIIDGPGFQRWDFSLFKNIQIRESVKVQLRGEAFNVFNHPNPLAYTTAITSPTYGRVTSFRDPRIMQLGAKFYF
jgi:hypothetical protein